MKAYRPINFRAFAVIALFVLATVFSVYIYALNRAAGIIIGVIIVLGTAAAFVIALVKLLRNDSKLRYCITFGLGVALCVLSLSLGANYVNFRESVAELSGYREIYGRICDIGIDNSYRVLDKLEIDGKPIGGKLSLKTTDGSFDELDATKCGDYLHFDGYLTVGDFICDDFSVNGYSVRTGVVFYSTVNAKNVAVAFGKAMPIKNFLHGLNALFTENMGEDYGNLAYAMLTGDKSGLAEQTVSYFGTAGLGHIMAVSGLHIGFFVLLLNFILCKVDKRIRFPIIIAVLFAYMTVADFSPSVVRAFVMTAVSMLSFMVGGRRDILSSMCCAAALILAFKPFYLFEAGFLLSFGAIFGIAMFSSAIKRALTKIKIHNKIAEAVSASVSVQAGILPAQLALFNEIQFLAPITNMILIPYISIVFIIIIVCAPIAAIPNCGAILKFGMYLLIPVDGIAQGIASVPFATFQYYATPAVFFCYPVMFFASNFFMMPRGKISVVLAAAVTCMTLCATPYPPPSSFLCAVNGYTTESIVYYDRKTYIIGYAANKYGLCSVLDSKRLRKIDGVYLLGERSNTLDTLLYLNERYEMGEVYCFDSGDFGVRFIESGIDFRLADDKNEILTVRLAGEFVGYEYCSVLFAADNADEIGFMHYTTVRARSVNYLRDGVTYYCNYLPSGAADLHINNYRVLNGKNYYIDLRDKSEATQRNACRLSALSAV